MVYVTTSKLHKTIIHEQANHSDNLMDSTNYRKFRGQLTRRLKEVKMACSDYRFITINDSHKLRKELSVLRRVTSSLSSPLSFFSADNSNLYYAYIFSDSKYYKIDSLMAAISSASINGRIFCLNMLQ